VRYFASFLEMTKKVKSYLTKHFFSCRYSFLAPLKNPRIAYPRESSLTHQEHKRYIELFTGFNAYVPTNPTPAEMNDILQFKVSQSAVFSYIQCSPQDIFLGWYW
jgi:hypothetical protein